MSALSVSAPGKLVLLGEYAVLDGAPALVAAVSARARVTLRPSDQFQIRSSLLDTALDFVLEGGAVRWRNAAAAPAAAPAVAEWLGKLIAANAPAQHAAGFIAELDTGDFFQQGSKFGLGSSSALAVAFNAALQRHWHNATVSDAFATHRLLQGGRGSGVDVAAAVQGGLLGFSRGQSADQPPRIEALQWPDSLALTVVFVGHSSSTVDAIGRYREWQQRAPSDWQAHHDRLREIAVNGKTSVKSGDCAGLMQALNEYGRALHAMGQSAGIDIVSQAHQRVGKHVSAFGPAVYKPSGAGGGDVGIAVSHAQDAVALRAHLRAQGVTVLDLSIDDKGLEIG